MSGSVLHSCDPYWRDGCQSVRPLPAVQILDQLRNGSGLLEAVRSVFTLCRVVANPTEVLTHLVLGRFPLRLIQRSSGRVYTCYDLDQVYLKLCGFNFDFNPESSTISFSSKGGTVRFAVPPYGDLVGIFQRGDYASLNPQGATVLDIGAHNADSSIYFALSGALHVIGIEPAYAAIANTNIGLNHLTNVDIIQGVVVGNTPDDSRFLVKRTGLDTSVQQSESGVLLRAYTIDSLVRDITSSNLILKMDCEGWEYDIIRSTSTTILGRFKQIAIEYHYGPQDLPCKLRQAGFYVDVTAPAKLKNRKFRSTNLEVGFIFASRK